MGRGLSEDQKKIIIFVGRWTLFDRERMGRPESDRVAWDGWQRRDDRGLSAGTRSRQAAISRALRRLAERGLVRRWDYDKETDYGRTNRVQLTDPGWDAYHRLILAERPD